MKILVVFLLCASAFGLPVDDRIVSPEELLQRVLAAHPLENDIELNKRKNEAPLPKEGIPVQTLVNREGSSPNIDGGEDTVEEGIIPEVLEKEVTTETQAPEEVFTSTVDPKISDETKKPATVFTQAENITLDPQMNITEDKPSSEDQYSDKIAVGEQELNNTDSGITTENSIEENETIPDKKPIQDDNSSPIELPQNAEHTKSSEHSSIMNTDEKKTDDKSTTDDRPNKDISVTNDPQEKPMDSGVEDVVKSELYQDTTEPGEIFDTTETIPESLSLENNPFLVPEDTLLNEPDLLGGIAMEESPSDASTQDHKFNKDPEGITSTTVESVSNALDLSIDNHPLATEMSSDTGTQTDFEPHFDEEESPPIISEDGIKLLPEEFKSAESPGLVNGINPTSYLEKEISDYSQHKEILPVLEEEELLENPSSRVKPDTDNLEEPTLENDQIFRSELDPSLLMDTFPKNTQHLKNFTEARLNNKSNQEAYMGGDKINEQKILKEKSNVLSSFPVPKMDEYSGHDPHLINQAVGLELLAPKTFSENRDLITDEPFFEIDSTVEELEQIPAAHVDSFSRVLDDSDFIEEPVTQETLYHDPIANMDTISNGNHEVSRFVQEPVIPKAFDQYPITESDAFLDKTHHESALTHEIKPEELDLDSAAIADEFPYQTPDELEFNQYHTIPDQLGDEASNFMNEGTVLINPESISDNPYIEENHELSHYESSLNHEIMPEELDLGSEAIAGGFPDQTPHELDFNQYHATPDQLGDEASNFINEGTVLINPESISDNPYIEENHELSHYESSLNHEIMPEELDLGSEVIAEGFPDQTPHELDFNQYHSTPDQLGDEASNFMDEGTMLINPESISDNPYIEENHELSHYESGFNHEIMPEELDLGSEVIAEGFPDQTPHELDFNQYHTTPDHLGDEASNFMDEGTMLINPESISDNPYIEENHELSHYESSLNHEIMPEELDLGSEVIAEGFPDQTPHELDFNQYHSTPDQLGDEASNFMDEGTMLINPESISDNPYIEENHELSHYESGFNHEIMPEELDLGSEVIAEGFPDQTPHELDFNQYHTTPDQLGDEASNFMDEGTMLINPESISDNPYIEENHELSHYESGFNHEIMPEVLDLGSEGIAEEFSDQIPHELDFDQYHATPDHLGDEASNFMDGGVVLINPESISGNPYIGKIHEMSQEPVPFIENLPIVENQDPYEDNENLGFDMKDTLPIQEFTDFSNYNPYEESNGDPVDQQLWDISENYPEPNMPRENDGQIHSLVEEGIDNSSIRDYVTEETTKETVAPNFSIWEISKEDFPPGEESLSSRDMDSTQGEIEANDQGKVPAKITDERKITYVAKKPRFDAPLLESQDAYYPYSLIPQDYQPFYLPYSTERKFLDDSPKKTDYKSVIIILNPSVSKSRSESKISPGTKSRSDSDIPSDINSRSESDILSNDTTKVETHLQEEHDNTTTNSEMEVAKKDSVENAIDLPPKTTFQPEFPERTTTQSDLAVRTSPQPDLPPKKSTQSDLAVRTSTQPDLPPRTSTQPDLPPRTSLQTDLPPITSFQPDLPPRTSFQPDLPPRTSFHPDLPPRTSFQPDLPPRTSFHPNLPPRTSFQPDLEIPYPSNDQDFHSRPSDHTRKPFTWYPITREQQQSDFGESQPIFSKEYDYILVHPYGNNFNDFSQLAGDNYRFEYGSPYYQISDDIQADNNYEILPYFERDNSYNKDPEDIYNGFYY